MLQAYSLSMKELFPTLPKALHLEAKPTVTGQEGKKQQLQMIMENLWSKTVRISMEHLWYMEIVGAHYDVIDDVFVFFPLP